MTSSNKLININENVVNLSTVKYDLDAPLLHRLDEQQVVPVAPVVVWITSELVHVAAHVPVRVTPFVEE
jgi:hypothetical protein